MLYGSLPGLRGTILRSQIHSYDPVLRLSLQQTRFGKLREDVTYEARVHRVQYTNDLKSSSRKRVRVHYSGSRGQVRKLNLLCPFAVLNYFKSHVR